MQLKDVSWKEVEGSEISDALVRTEMISPNKLPHKTYYNIFSDNEAENDWNETKLGQEMARLRDRFDKNLPLMYGVRLQGLQRKLALREYALDYYTAVGEESPSSSNVRPNFTPKSPVGSKLNSLSHRKSINSPGRFAEDDAKAVQLERSIAMSTTSFLPASLLSPSRPSQPRSARAAEKSANKRVRQSLDPSLLQPSRYEQGLFYSRGYQSIPPQGQMDSANYNPIPSTVLGQKGGSFGVAKANRDRSGKEKVSIQNALRAQLAASEIEALRLRDARRMLLPAQSIVKDSTDPVLVAALALRSRNREALSCGSRFVDLGMAPKETFRSWTTSGPQAENEKQKRGPGSYFLFDSQSDFHASPTRGKKHIHSTAVVVSEEEKVKGRQPINYVRDNPGPGAYHPRKPSPKVRNIMLAGGGPRLRPIVPLDGPGPVSYQSSYEDSKLAESLKPHAVGNYLGGRGPRMKALGSFTEISQPSTVGSIRAGVLPRELPHHEVLAPMRSPRQFEDMALEALVPVDCKIDTKSNNPEKRDSGKEFLAANYRRVLGDDAALRWETERTARLRSHHAQVIANHARARQLKEAKQQAVMNKVAETANMSLNNILGQKLPARKWLVVVAVARAFGKMACIMGHRMSLKDAALKIQKFWRFWRQVKSDTHTKLGVEVTHLTHTFHMNKCMKQAQMQRQRRLAATLLAKFFQEFPPAGEARMSFLHMMSKFMKSVRTCQRICRQFCQTSQIRKSILEIYWKRIVSEELKKKHLQLDISGLLGLGKLETRRIIELELRRRKYVHRVELSRWKEERDRYIASCCISKDELARVLSGKEPTPKHEFSRNFSAITRPPRFRLLLPPRVLIKAYAEELHLHLKSSGAHLPPISESAAATLTADTGTKALERARAVRELSLLNVGEGKKIGNVSVLSQFAAEAGGLSVLIR